MHAFFIPFPDLSPEIFAVELFGSRFALRWYALAYIVGIVIAWRLAVGALRRPALWPEQRPPMKPAQVEDLLTWIILGVILGGRLGYVMFYQPGYYLVGITFALISTFIAGYLPSNRARKVDPVKIIRGT